MRTIVSLLTAAVLLLVGSSQALAVNRVIATTCYGSQYLVAQRFSPDVQWVTGVPCNNYVPDPFGKPQYVVGRPISDLYAATDAAHHFWPGCGLEWYGVNDQRSAPGHWYYVYYRVSCP